MSLGTTKDVWNLVKIIATVFVTFVLAAFCATDERFFRGLIAYVAIIILQHLNDVRKALGVKD